MVQKVMKHKTSRMAKGEEQVMGDPFSWIGGFILKQVSGLHVNNNRPTNILSNNKGKKEKKKEPPLFSILTLNLNPLQPQFGP